MQTIANQTPISLHQVNVARKSILSLTDFVKVQGYYQDMKKRHARHMTWGSFAHKCACEEIIQNAEQNLARIEWRRS